MKKAKPIKQKEPEITLVWSFRWSDIYIVWNIAKAKEYSEYMELWFQALQAIDMQVSDSQVLLSKRKNNVSTTKTKRS